MTHQIDVLSAQKCICLSRCVISWKTTGKQMELAVLHCSSGTIATCPVFPIKQAIIGLEEREQLLLDLSHLETHLH